MKLIGYAADASPQNQCIARSVSCGIKAQRDCKLETWLSRKVARVKKEMQWEKGESRLNG